MGSGSSTITDVNELYATETAELIRKNLSSIIECTQEVIAKKKHERMSGLFNILSSMYVKHKNKTHLLYAWRFRLEKKIILLIQSLLKFLLI